MSKNSYLYFLELSLYVNAVSPLLTSMNSCDCLNTVVVHASPKLYGLLVTYISPPMGEKRAGGSRFFCQKIAWRVRVKFPSTQLDPTLRLSHRFFLNARPIHKSCRPPSALVFIEVFSIMASLKHWMLLFDLKEELSLKRDPVLSWTRTEVANIIPW